MSRKRYAIKESLQRILVLFKDGGTINENPNTLTGNLLSEDESLSDVAELFNNSLPNETLTLPTAFINAVNTAITPVIYDVSGTFAQNPTSLDTIVLVDSSATGVSVELPNPSDYNGYKFWIKKLSSIGQINIYPTNGGQIDNENVLFVTEQYNAVTLIAVNGNWWII